MWVADILRTCLCKVYSVNNAFDDEPFHLACKLNKR